MRETRIKTNLVNNKKEPPYYVLRISKKVVEKHYFATFESAKRFFDHYTGEPVSSAPNIYVHEVKRNKVNEFWLVDVTRVSNIYKGLK